MYVQLELLDKKLDFDLCVCQGDKKFKIINWGIPNISNFETS